MGLVVEVGANYGRVVQVSGGKGSPVGDPLGLGHRTGVPKGALAV